MNGGNVYENNDGIHRINTPEENKTRIAGRTEIQAIFMHFKELYQNMISNNELECRYLFAI